MNKQLALFVSQSMSTFLNIQNTKYKIQIQNTEYKIQNKKYKIQNTKKHKIQ